MNDTCLFCKIIDGSEPAQIVLKNTSVIAFFPRIMNSKGHMIIAPIQHYVNILDIQEDVLSSLLETIKFLSNHCRGTLGASGFNVLHASGESAQQSINHFHFHLLPRYQDDNLDAWPNLPAWTGNSVELLKILRVPDLST